MNDPLLSLVANTPSAPLKLSAAWDGLSTESQMEVLHALQHSGRLPSDVATKAMASPNAFVRYLAAERVATKKHMEFAKEAVGVNEGIRIEVDDEFRPAFNAALNDPDPLVRSAVEEGPHGYPDRSPETCQTFWGLSKPARFRYLRSRDGLEGGRDVVALIDYAVENHRPEDEVTEILVEYVKLTKSLGLPGRFSLLAFAERSPGYASFIREELEPPHPPNSLLAWVEPRVIPMGKERVFFELKEPIGAVAGLAREICLVGAFIGLLIGVKELVWSGVFAPLPFLVVLVLWAPPLFKTLLVHQVEKSAGHSMWGYASPKRLVWIRRAWRLSWLLILLVGVGAGAILVNFIGPGLVTAYRELDLRLLTSTNLALLLVLLWRTARRRIPDATVARR